MGVTSLMRSSSNGVVNTKPAVHTTPIISQIKPAPTDIGGNSVGRFVRRVRTITHATISSPSRYTSKPAPARGRIPKSEVSVVTPMPTHISMRARTLVPRAFSTILVRSIVGQNVIRVPTTVIPTNPRTFTASCASINCECSVPRKPGRAVIAPSTAPTGSRNAAAI